MTEGWVFVWGLELLAVDLGKDRKCWRVGHQRLVALRSLRSVLQILSQCNPRSRDFLRLAHLEEGQEWFRNSHLGLAEVRLKNKKEQFWLTPLATLVLLLTFASRKVRREVVQFEFLQDISRAEFQSLNMRRSRAVACRASDGTAAERGISPNSGTDARSP